MAIDSRRFKNGLLAGDTAITSPWGFQTGANAARRITACNAQLSKSLIRDARARPAGRRTISSNWSIAGYVGMINSGDGDRGVAAYPYEFYAKWIADPEGTREMVESSNRSTIGTEECPIDSIPNKKIVHR